MNKLNKYKNKVEIEKRASAVAAGKKKLFKIYGSRLITAVARVYPCSDDLSNSSVASLINIIKETRGAKKKVNGTSDKRKIAQILKMQATENIGYDYINPVKNNEGLELKETYLEQKRRQLLAKHKKSFYDIANPIFDAYPAGSRGQIFYKFNETSNFEEWGGDSSSELNWENKFNSSGWAPRDWYFSFVVETKWYKKIYCNGLFELDGMLTIAADNLMSDFDGVEIYRASWLRRGRGKNVVNHTGFIAVTRDESGEVESAYHGQTYKKTIAGLQRKVRNANRPLQIKSVNLSIDDFIAKFQKFDFLVTLDDAYDSGSCKSGVEAWVQSCDLNFEKGYAHIREVLDAFKIHPLPEVRFAVVRAFYRRHKRANAA